MKLKLLCFLGIIFLGVISLAGESQNSAPSDVKIKLEGGGIEGTFEVTTNETSCGRLNWGAVPNKQGEMSGGQYEISVQLVNDTVVLKEHTLATHEGIGSDITAKTTVPLKKLPWTGKLSQTSVKLFRKGQEPKEHTPIKPDADDGK